MVTDNISIKMASCINQPIYQLKKSIRKVNHRNIRREAGQIAKNGCCILKVLLASGAKVVGFICFHPLPHSKSRLSLLPPEVILVAIGSLISKALLRI